MPSHATTVSATSLSTTISTASIPARESVSKPINGIMVVEELAEVVDVDAVVVMAEDIAPYHYSIVGHMEEITVMSAHSV